MTEIMCVRELHDDEHYFYLFFKLLMKKKLN